MTSEWAAKMRAIQPGPGVFVTAGNTWSPKVKPVRVRPHWDRAALRLRRKASRAARRAQRRHAR